MTTCQECGEPLKSNSAFCTHCGAPVLAAESRGDPWVSILVGLGLLLFAVVVGIVLLALLKPPDATVLLLSIIAVVSLFRWMVGK